MGLRITTFESGDAAEAPLNESPSARLERIVSAAATAIRLQRPQDLAQIYADLADWDDQHRAFQARRQLVELVFAAQSSLPDGAWIPLYVATTRALVDALATNPREPIYLNYAGVLLYELLETSSAELLFRAASRLDADLEHVRANLKAARTRRGRGRDGRKLMGRFGHEAGALAARARTFATSAAPAHDLKVSLCMIVKDEEELLPGCLEAAHEYVDEIVIVDTGSTDRTVEIAESYGAKVIEFPWNGSFSDARNVSLDAASGDWILYLDADEHLVPDDAPNLRALLGRTWREGFYLVETNYTGGDDSGSAVTHLALRLFRNRPEYRFEGRIHEQKTQSMPTYLPERFETSGIRMLHYGYLKSRINAKEKSLRNIQLLELEALESASPFNAFNLGSEYLQMGDAKQARVHFDSAWEQLKEMAGWESVGYAPMLVSRAVTARRAAGDHEGAQELVEQGLAAFPDHTDLVLELAIAAEEQGKLAEGAVLAERALELGDAPAKYAGTVGSGTYLALCLLAVIAVKDGDPARAEELYIRSLAEYPMFVAPVLPLSTLMLARGASPEEVAAQVPSDRPSAMLLLATACYEAGHLAAGEHWFSAVLERQPANSVARIGLTEALLSQQRYAEAAAAAELEPTDSALAAAAAGARLFAYGAAGDTPALCAAVELLTDVVPAYELQFYAAWADALGGARPTQPLPAACGFIAVTALEALLRVKEVDAFATLLSVFERISLPAAEKADALGCIYFRRGFLESAGDEWIAAFEHTPEARFLVCLAQVAVARSLPDDAVQLATGALELEPDNREAIRMLEALGERQRAAA